jgi:hypothetical protein
VHYGNDRPPLMRSQTFVDVTVASTLVLGPNPRRVGLIISTPVPTLSLQVNHFDQIAGADTSSTGVKLTSGTSGAPAFILDYAAFTESTGVLVQAALRLNDLNGSPLLGKFTSSGAILGPIPIPATDTITWEVLTAEAASQSDFSILWHTLTAPTAPRVTLSFQLPAVLDNGVNLHAGNAPLCLCYNDIGAAFMEPIFAIGSAGTQRIGVIELLSP